MNARKGGLGRNLDSLIPTAIKLPGNETVIADRDEVLLSAIKPNPKQPRTVFDEDALKELAASIKEVGVLQPPVVRKSGADTYELIMGERRVRAAKLAGLTSIPVIIRQTPDNELLREAILENIHRSQLNALEEAAAYNQLLTDFGYTHEELATKLGKSRPLISNTIRLLNLPPSVQRRVAAGTISAGHARALLGLADQHEIEKLANRIVAEGLSVRAVEEIISLGSKSKTTTTKNKTTTSPEIKELGVRLSDALDTRVNIEMTQKRGKIVIEFGSLEDLHRIIDVID
ncbi:MAG: ParB/RepB/Spo0J family partition protein [Actinobacteria bacterium]|jgi:ParB family chromosome partitioning protein|nr:ParB/RepB/Spo0J family partition protein [Actinomycetota bacterium]NDH12810.1 ParB/RepB/Spo0J family partition protein [Actinomycetota bacterium]TRZ84544.1 MAG: ParB/RepB/Spo0J family partition protein [Streptomycetaceae bacterium]